MKRTVLSVLLMMAFLLGALPAHGQEYRIGTYLKFGAYPQTKVGNDRTEIEWLILDQDGDRLLLVSRYALDCKPYHAGREAVTWETCSLRTWLNKDFYYSAFSQEERARICLTHVDNGKEQNDTSVDGNDTDDHVFLLSCAEAEKYFRNQYALQCAVTDYAKAKGAHTEPGWSVDGRSCGWWWLRSVSELEKGWARDVTLAGTVLALPWDGRGQVVRPAIWLDVGPETAADRADTTDDD